MTIFMDRDEQLANLRLIRTPNMSSMTFSLLLQHFGSARAALDAVPELARRDSRSLKSTSRAAARTEIEAVEGTGAKLLFKGGDDYPKALERFDDARLCCRHAARRPCCYRHPSPSFARVTPRAMRSGWRKRCQKNWQQTAMSWCPAWRAELTPRPMIARWLAAPSR